MIEAHFPEIANSLDGWDRVAIPLAEAPGALRSGLSREIEERRLGHPPYNRENLVQRIGDFTNERAVQGTLSEVPNLEPNQGSIWYDRALIGLEMRGLQVIDMHSVSHNDYSARAREFMAPVNALFLEAQQWPEATEIVTSRQAVARQASDVSLSDAIRAQLLREQIFVAASCPACGEPHELTAPQSKPGV